jgi:hypothetical protein
MALVFAGEEDDDAVLGEQSYDILGPVEVAVVTIGPVQAADGIDVLELPHAMFESCEPCVEVGHGAPPSLVSNLTNVADDLT